MLCVATLDVPRGHARGLLFRRTRGLLCDPKAQALGHWGSKAEPSPRPKGPGVPRLEPKGPGFPRAEPKGPCPRDRAQGGGGNGQAPLGAQRARPIRVQRARPQWTGNIGHIAPSPLGQRQAQIFTCWKMYPESTGICAHERTLRTCVQFGASPLQPEFQRGATARFVGPH